MKYSIVLQRKAEFKAVQKPNNPKIEDSTLGEWTIFDELGKEVKRFYSCENIGPSTDTPNQDKRIVAREYKLEWTDSSKNASLAKAYPQYKMPNGRHKAIWVTCDDVLPRFRHRRILIHVGNYPQDTEGCILLGRAKGKGTISQSVLACHEFFAFVESVGIENLSLEVKEIPNRHLGEESDISLRLRETSASGKHSSLENFESSQAHSLASPPKFSKNPQSPTASATESS